MEPWRHSKAATTTYAWKINLRGYICADWWAHINLLILASIFVVAELIAIWLFLDGEGQKLNCEVFRVEEYLRIQNSETMIMNINRIKWCHFTMLKHFPGMRMTRRGRLFRGTSLLFPRVVIRTGIVNIEFKVTIAGAVYIGPWRSRRPVGGMTNDFCIGSHFSVFFFRLKVCTLRGGVCHSVYLLFIHGTCLNGVRPKLFHLYFVRLKILTNNLLFFFHCRWDTICIPELWVSLLVERAH